MPYLIITYNIGAEFETLQHIRAVYRTTSVPAASGSHIFTFPLPTAGASWQISDSVFLTPGSQISYTYSSVTGRTINYSGGNTSIYTANQITSALDEAALSGVTNFRWVTSAVYNITYYNVGGLDNSANPVTYITSIGAKMYPVLKTGYNFSGWFSHSAMLPNSLYPSGGPGIWLIAEGSSGNRNAYAKFTPSTYTISYVLGGGVNNANNPSLYNIESASINLQNPTRAGYTFGGWYEEEEFINRIYTLPSGSTGNRTFYAKWTINVYGLYYTLNGGINDPGNPGSYTIESATITLIPPSRTGYSFVEWRLSNASGAVVTTVPQGSTGTKTLFAIWAPVIYTISYHLNGGINNPSNPATYNITTPSFSFLDPTRAHYVFMAWCSDPALTNVIYGINQGSTGNRSVYALYDPSEYYITYNLNGGTNSAANPSSYNIESGEIAFADPTRAHYIFGGWYTDSGFNNAITTLPAGSFDDLTLYAKWSPAPYSITYNGTEGATNPNPVSYNITTAAISLVNISRVGYTFGGWFGDEDLTISISQIGGGETGDLTLWAKWSVVTYSITYTLNGGANSPLNPVSYNIETSAIGLENANRTGYTFDGWYSESGFVNLITEITAGSTGNKIFYAKWTQDSYAITYVMDGGTNNGSNPLNYTYESATITFALPTKMGYDFVGWFSAASGGSAFTSIPAKSTGNKTVYARWLIRSAAVNLYNRYILKNGSVYNVLVKSASFNYNTPVVMGLSDTASLTKNKQSSYTYTFKGWTRDINSTTNDSFTNASVVWDNNLSNLLTGVGTMDAALTKGGNYYAVWDRRKSGLKIGGGEIKIKIGENSIKKITKGTSILWEKEND